MKASAIKGQFTKHIKLNGENYEEWYCGITKSPKQRMSKHRRNFEDITCFKMYQALNVKQANEVEKHFAKRGTANAKHKGGATSKSTKVYIFKFSEDLRGLYSTSDILNVFFK